PLRCEVRRDPGSLRLVRDGELQQETPETGASATNDFDNKQTSIDATAGQAMKTAVFWLLVISMTARVACYSTVTVHFVPLMVWKGLSHAAAASLLAAFADRKSTRLNSSHGSISYA